MADGPGGFYILENDLLTNLPPESEHILLSFSLHQNYPNPFNPTTAIGYQLSMLSQVELSIYNILGQKVATPVSEKQPAGNYKVEWDASGLSSGLYIYSLQAGIFIQQRKMLLMK